MCGLETSRVRIYILRFKVSALYFISTLLYPTKATETEQVACGREYSVGVQYYRELHGTNFLRRNEISDSQVTKLQTYCLFKIPDSSVNTVIGYVFEGQGSIPGRNTTVPIREPPSTSPYWKGSVPSCKP